jgi:hypothetical protein
VSGAAALRKSIGVQAMHLVLLGAFGALLFYVTRATPEAGGRSRASSSPP